jgi:predicted DNA-binding protein
MTPLKLAAFRLPDELIAALQEIKDRDGIPVAEQVRRALESWVKSKGVKSERKRPASRKRS